jgi:hypothetical protein
MGIDMFDSPPILSAHVESESVCVGVVIRGCRRLKQPQCPQCPQCPPSAGSATIGEAHAEAGAKCGSDNIVVSTGTSEGKCTHGQGADGKVQTLTCDDGKGNGGSLTCKDGVVLCSSSGAGKCTFK